MKYFISIVLFINIISNTYAQGGVAVNNNGNPADPSAIFDISSNDKGVLIPRVALSATNISAPIIAPANSLLVYNTATSGTTPNNVTPGFYYWDGSQWQSITSGGGSVQDTDVDSVTLNVTTLNVYEGGNGYPVDLSTLLTPPGIVETFAGTTAPSGYLLCDGSAVSRTTYSALFAVIGTIYGNGDGSTTFNVPDYRGQFLRGVDNGFSGDPDAATRTDRGDGVTGDAVGTRQSNQVSSHNHAVNPPNTNTNSTGNHAHSVDPPSTNTNTTGNHAHSVDPPNTTSSTTGSHNHGGNTGGVSSFNGNIWIPYDDNTNTSAVSVSNLPISTCGNPWNTIGTAGNFMGRMNSNCLSHGHSISSDGNHNHSINIAAFNSNTTGNHAHSVNISSFNSSTTGNHSHSVDIPNFNSSSHGGNETRPTNVYVNYIIKY